ncbi:retrovirus-related pol polyprotein LINE-1, partial [Tanacetum coccineum]
MIITLTLVIDGETVNMISAYAPQVLSEEDKKTFWDSLDEIVEFPTNQQLFLGGDLNGHRGTTTEGYLGVHRGFGYGEGRECLAENLMEELNEDATEAFRARVVEGVSTQDILGVAIGTSKSHTAYMESWWLCEEVQSKVAVKQARFRELLLCREGNQEERLRAQE